MLSREEVERLNEAWGHITPEWDQPGLNPAYEHNRDLIEAVRTAQTLYAELDEALAKLDEATGFDGIMRQIDTYYPLELPYFHDSNDPGCVAMRAQRQCLLATERAEKAEAERDQLAAEGLVLREALAQLYEDTGGSIREWFCEAREMAEDALNSAPLITAEAERVKRLEGEAERLKEELKHVHAALDDSLGDSDPEDYTNDELREYEPVLWAVQQIAKLIGPGPWDSAALEGRKS